MIEIESLSKSFRERDGERLLFSDVNLRLPSRGMIFLLGRSGSGKSTFLQLLSCVEKPTKGRVRVDGEGITSYTESKACDFRQGHIGFLFQNHHLEGRLSALENVMLPLLLNGFSEKEAKAKAQSAFEGMGISHLQGRRASELSGGERARVGFLRASIHEPDFLLCDEPTGALDKENGLLLMEKLKELSKEKLVLVVSHDEELAKSFLDGELRLEKESIHWEKRPPFECFEERKETENKPSKRSRMGFLYRKDAWARFRKGIPTFLAVSFMFLSLFASIALYNGGEAFLKDGKDRSLLYCSATISDVESVEINDAKIKLSRSKRPSKEAVEDAYSSIGSLKVKNDYSYFFPESLPYIDHGYSCEAVSFCPVWDITLKDRARPLLKAGELPSGPTLDYVLVNQAMADRLKEEIIGNIIEVSSKAVLQLEQTMETVSLSFSFKVIGVVEDYAFLSVPRVFYSYPAFEKKMQKTKIGSKSLFDLVNEANGSTELSSYRYRLFYDETEASSLEGLSVQSAYQIVSPLWSAQEGFASIWRVMEVCFTPFLAAQIAIVAFCLAALSQKRFDEKRGFFVLLKALGLKEGSRIWLFEWDVFVILAGSLALAWALALPVTNLLSALMEWKFSLPQLAVLPISSWLGVSYLLPLASLAFAIVLFLFASHLPLLIQSHKCLSTELKDE